MAEHTEESCPEGLNRTIVAGGKEPLEAAFKLMEGFRQQSMAFTNDLMDLATKSEGLLRVREDLGMLIEVIETAAAEAEADGPVLRVARTLKRRHFDEETA